MDFKGMADKAKDWARENPDKADGYVDKASDAVGSRTGHEQQVDSAGDKAKNFLHGPEGGAAGDPGPGGQQPPPEGGQPPPPPEDRQAPPPPQAPPR